MFHVLPWPNIKVNGEIMYFLVNASLPKPLDMWVFTMVYQLSVV